MATVKLLEEILVSRPPDATVPTTVPLSFFDVYWMSLVPVQRIFLYAVPDLTTTHFTSTIVPALKTSLSVTLGHFFPISGRLIVSWPAQLPYIRCDDGDSVSVAVCETAMDFNHLGGDGPKSVADVQALVPKLTPRDEKDDARPLVAVQITVFPKSGFSIGITYSHVAADGRGIVHFIKSWASVCRSGGDTNFISDCPPDHRRDLISDPDNRIASLNVEENLSFGKDCPRNLLPVEKFRYTFIVGPLKVNELKAWVTRKSMQDQQFPPAPPLRVSTFMVTCALVWVCFVQAQLETRQSNNNNNNNNNTDHGDDETVCNFLFLADVRKKLNLSTNYFGNCLRSCYAAAKRGELVGEEGIYAASKAIGRATEEVEKEGVKGAEEWLKRAKKIFETAGLHGHVMTIAGSPRFGVYETDFGWGRPKNAEHAHIGTFGSIAIADSRIEDGGVEFCLVLSLHEFERFNHAFHYRSASCSV